MYLLTFIIVGREGEMDGNSDQSDGGAPTTNFNQQQEPHPEGASQPHGTPPPGFHQRPPPYGVPVSEYFSEIVEIFLQ